MARDLNVRSRLVKNSFFFQTRATPFSLYMILILELFYILDIDAMKSTCQILVRELAFVLIHLKLYVLQSILHVWQSASRLHWSTRHCALEALHELAPRLVVQSLQALEDMSGLGEGGGGGGGVGGDGGGGAAAEESERSVVDCGDAFDELDGV